MTEHITTPDHLDALPVGFSVRDGNARRWTSTEQMTPTGRTWRTDDLGSSLSSRGLLNGGPVRPDAPTPTPAEQVCTYTFPLPSWAGEDQMEPCRCDLPTGHPPTDHPSGHSCSHLRGGPRA